MTYNINKTNGDLLVQIPDGQFETSTTSLTLIGKNVTSFGEALNENLVKLLESFASASSPEQAIRGQLWYDTSSGRLNVYDGNTFRAAGGPQISPSTPINLVSGDLWINNETNQLHFYDGTDLVLAGPIFTNSQGRSGFVVETVFDTANRSRVICLLYVSNVLLGIFSKDAFTPQFTINGYGPAGTPIEIGFNASELTNQVFNVTAAAAEGIVYNGVVKQSTELAYLNEDNTFENPITVHNNNCLILGGLEQIQVNLLGNDLYIDHQITDRDILLRVKPGGTTVDAITVKGATSRVGVFNSNPQYTLDVNGTMNVSTAFKLPLYATAPTSGAEKGHLIYNTTTNKVQVYTGSSWVNLH